MIDAPHRVQCDRRVAAQPHPRTHLVRLRPTEVRADHRGALLHREAALHVTSRAPSLIDTDEVVSVTREPPRDSSMPADVRDSRIGALTAGGPTSMVRPPPSRRSLRVTVIASVFHTLTAGSPARGVSRSRHRAPARIGQSASPPSNSTQICAWTGGAAEKAAPGPA